MEHEFSAEDVKALAFINREMDAGRQPFVLYNGGRCAVRTEAMEELELEQGQAIDSAIFTALCRLNIAHYQSKIAEIQDEDLSAEFISE